MKTAQQVQQELAAIRTDAQDIYPEMACMVTAARKAMATYEQIPKRAPTVTYDDARTFAEYVEVLGQRMGVQQRKLRSVMDGGDGRAGYALLPPDAQNAISAKWDDAGFDLATEVKKKLFPIASATTTPEEEYAKLDASHGVMTACTAALPDGVKTDPRFYQAFVLAFNAAKGQAQQADEPETGTVAILSRIKAPEAVTARPQDTTNPKESSDEQYVALQQARQAKNRLLAADEDIKDAPPVAGHTVSVRTIEGLKAVKQASDGTITVTADEQQDRHVELALDEPLTKAGTPVALREMWEAMEQDGRSNVDGATGLLVAVSGPVVTALHTGDTRLVAFVETEADSGIYEPVSVTADHHPTDPLERMRIEAGEGRIITSGTSSGRLYSAAGKHLEPGRSLGDGHVKGIPSEPDITQLDFSKELSQGRKVRLGLATDGAFEGLNEWDYAKLLGECNGERFAERAANAAFCIGASTDNILWTDVPLSAKPHDQTLVLGAFDGHGGVACVDALQQSLVDQIEQRNRGTAPSLPETYQERLELQQRAAELWEKGEMDVTSHDAGKVNYQIDLIARRVEINNGLRDPQGVYTGIGVDIDVAIAPAGQLSVTLDTIYAGSSLEGVVDAGKKLTAVVIDGKRIDLTIAALNERRGELGDQPIEGVDYGLEVVKLLRHAPRTHFQVVVEGARDPIDVDVKMFDSKQQAKKDYGKNIQLQQAMTALVDLTRDSSLEKKVAETYTAREQDPHADKYQGLNAEQIAQLKTVRKAMKAAIYSENSAAVDDMKTGRFASRVLQSGGQAGSGKGGTGTGGGRGPAGNPGKL